MAGEKSANTPVGSKGLTEVGSPNRIQRRTPGTANFSTPSARAPANAFSTPMPSSSFAERVYQSTGGRYGRTTTPGSVFSTPYSDLRGPTAGESALTRPSMLIDELEPQGSFGTPAPAAARKFGVTKNYIPPTPAGSTSPGPVVKRNGGKASGSAVPETVVDLPSQRIYALGALALLVAWKAYDAIGLTVGEPEQTSLLLFLKWSLLDAAVWYCAWRLRIPKLTVSAPAMYALIAASIFIDINLFLLSSSLFVMAVKPMAVGIASSCLRTLKGVPWLGPRLVGDSDLLIDSFELDDEHILGRHTIHILPHSLAHMNPQTKSFCINDRTLRSEPWYRRLTAGLLSNQGIHHRSQQPTIPILINGTVPASIRYVFTSFETGERQIRAVGNVGALRMETTAVYPTLGNWVMATYHLPITEIGAYEIYSVKDNKGLEFRTAQHAPPTIVVGCPTARLQWRTDSDSADNFVVGNDGHASICQRADSADSADSERTSGLIEAVVEGYEPIDMTIVRLVNGHREVIGLDGVQPRISEISAQAAAIGAAGDSDESKSAAHQMWSRYRARRSVYTLSDTFLRPGEYVYKLESVRDAANHTVALGDSAAIDGNRGLFNGDKASAGKATSYMARIQVHRRPTVGWTNSLLRSDLPLRLSDDKQRRSHYSLPLKLAGDGPWTVEYEIVDGAEVVRETKEFSTAKNAYIEASRPGVYHLLSLQDKHCAGKAESANVTLVQTPKPSVNITSTPITARECGGEIGAHIELELSGRPPFAIHYRERNLRLPNSRTVTRVVRSQQRHHSFKVSPELAGTYEFEFFRLEDDNYPSGQPISAVIQQAIHAQPSVKLDTSNGQLPSVICKGESLDLPLRFKGQGPWQITYNVVHESRRTSRTISDIADDRFIIELGAFDSPGQYTIELAQIKDGNQCKRDLLDIAATIRVREGGPRASFQCPDGGIRILDGEQARIPVQVSGEFPVDLQYRKIGDPSEGIYRATLGRRTKNSALQSDFVQAHGPGEYELVAANDICPGTVDSQSAHCLIKVEPKPRAWFATTGLKYEDKSSAHGEKGVWHLGDTCEASKSPGAFELGLSGSGPWKLEYRVDYWSWSNPQSGNPRTVDRTTTHTSVAMQQSTLKTECCDPGLYRYTLVAVSDERYQRLQPLDLHPTAATKESLTVVEHRVTRSPQAELRAYLPDGTPLDVSTKGAFRRKQRTIKHCLAPGQSRTEGDAQRWASVREQLPVFRIEFEKGGLAPFQAWVEVFPASGPSEVVAIRDIQGYSQAVALPDHIASQIGRYHMRLVKTRDARGCEHQFVDPSEVGLGRPDQVGASISGGIEIEYIEAPSARPASSSPSANPSRNVCVGDILSFDLRGLNSWNVDYTYNGDHRSTTANKRLFRRLVDEPGNFTLTRVCHRSANDCCSEFSDLAYSVHDIPRVRVSGGKNVYQDILEGDMVDIRMDLVGQPPFTFTWQRRGLATGGALGKVLESHTVKDFDGHAYTISTSSEGTFEVTFIQDQFCQYPKA